jgi:hypothetical protein
MIGSTRQRAQQIGNNPYETQCFVKGITALTIFRISGTHPDLYFSAGKRNNSMPMAAVEVARMLQRAIWRCGILLELMGNVLQNACSRSRGLMDHVGSRNLNLANMYFNREIITYLGNPGWHCDNNVVHGVTEAAGPYP